MSEETYLIYPSTFDEIMPIWRNLLWPGRKTDIEPDNNIRMELPRPADVTFYAAKDSQGHILGVISGFQTSPTHFRVRGVFVRESSRGSGVAKALYHAIEHVAIERGCKIIWSLARYNAWAFYEARGFKQTSEWDASYEFGPNAFVEKSLGGYYDRPTFPISNHLTHQNHFKFGYNGRHFNYRTSVNDTWNVQYGRCNRKPLSFKEEAMIAAKLIRENTDLPIRVLFSGGMDSEVAIRAFVDAGIPVTAVIGRFKHDLNIHDISYAVIACNALGVKYQFVDFDLLQFWHSDAYEYARKTYAVSPQLVSTMYVADQVDGYIVMGSGEPYIVKDVPLNYKVDIDPYPQGTWSLWEKEHIASWFRHFMVQDRPACPGFFQYTPELMYAFLANPIMRELVDNKHHGRLSSLKSKNLLYSQFWNMIPRQKYTGFEMVQEFDAPHRKRYRRMFPMSEQVVKHEYHALLRYMWPE